MEHAELLRKIKGARCVFLIGNGGSYANAQHIANDLVACGVAAFTLDAATLTATANDYGYEFIFSRWLTMVAEPQDLLIALSGSGRSPNIVRAVEEALGMEMQVHCIYGNQRGENMQEAEEAQIAIGHEIMRALKCAR